MYGIYPPQKVEDLIIEQAKRKAKEIVSKANVQMELEDQLLSDEKIQFEIDRITQDILNKMPSDLWNA